MKGKGFILKQWTILPEKVMGLPFLQAPKLISPDVLLATVRLYLGQVGGCYQLKLHVPVHRCKTS